jgi:hypothetical protein
VVVVQASVLLVLAAMAALALLFYLFHRQIIPEQQLDHRP